MASSGFCLIRDSAPQGSEGQEGFFTNVEGLKGGSGEGVERRNELRVEELKGQRVKVAVGSGVCSMPPLAGLGGMLGPCRGSPRTSRSASWVSERGVDSDARG